MGSPGDDGEVASFLDRTLGQTPARPADSIGWTWRRYGPALEGLEMSWFDLSDGEFRWRREKPCAKCGVQIARGYARTKAQIEAGGHELDCHAMSFEIPMALRCSKCGAAVLI